MCEGKKTFKYGHDAYLHEVILTLGTDIKVHVPMTKTQRKMLVCGHVLFYHWSIAELSYMFRVGILLTPMHHTYVTVISERLKAAFPLVVLITSKYTP